MLLTDAVPSTLSGFVGNPSALSKVKGWAESWESGGRQKPLLIWGPAGTGKTAAAHAVASQFGWELFEFNASDLRNEENVLRTLSAAASGSTISGSRRLVLIDDADALSGSDDRGGAAAISKVLGSSRQPVIVTATDYYSRKLQSIRAHCEAVQFYKVQVTSIANFLMKVAARCGTELRREDAEKIAQASSGDVRAALNDLQGRNLHAFRDSKASVFETLKTILKSSKYSEARAASFSSSIERNSLKLWVAHNLPFEYSLPFDVAEGYSAISRADVFDGRILRRQYWGYLRYSSDLLSAGVAVAKTCKYSKYVQFSYPDYIREMGASKSSRALRRQVLRKISAACHCSVWQAFSYFSLIKELLKKDEVQAAKYFGFDEDELSFVSKTASKRRTDAHAAARKKPDGSAAGAQAAKKKKAGHGATHAKQARLQ